MRVVIIGAGITGLVSCKYCKEEGFDVVVYEQGKDVGGTWIFTEETNTHSSMYKNLITNSPVEVMGFKDFEFPKMDKSYVTWREILKFIRDYEENYKLSENIKFQHKVTKVNPYIGNKWEVKVLNLIKNTEEIEIFDAVFVCNGHFSIPILPCIKGIIHYKGQILHSHEYRDPEMFKGKKVLVIGSGPSGIDITFDLSKTAKDVSISHHSMILRSDLFPMNVKQMPDVLWISENGCFHFANGKNDTFDAVIFCTGYKINFPFLSDESGVKVKENHVTFLYKHVVNIEHPTMFFIGLTNVTIFTHLIELQVQFSLKILTKKLQLPPKSEMLDNVNADIIERHSKNYKGKKMHQLWPEFMRKYIDDLVALANLTPIKPVLLDIYDESRALSYNDIKNYRKYRYEIINDREYVKRKIEI